jgi:opacity protein-like surface antigen
LGYDASDNFFISSEIIKEEEKSVNVIAGLQYHFAKQFFAKAGFISESTTVYAGAGVAWKNLRLDVSSSYHPQLGFSPGLLLIMNFKPKAE